VARAAPADSPEEKVIERLALATIRPCLRPVNPYCGVFGGAGAGHWCRRALPGVVTAADFILSAHAQIEAVAAGLPADWAATVWLMHGCGLRIEEALAANLRYQVSKGKTLRVREQVDQSGQLRRAASQSTDDPGPGPGMCRGNVAGRVGHWGV
jgi:hypothetical protein